MTHSCSYVSSSTVEDDIIVDQAESPEIIDDFELGQDEVVDIKDKEVNKQKLRRRIDQYKVSHLNFRLREDIVREDVKFLEFETGNQLTCA